MDMFVLHRTKEITCGIQSNVADYDTQLIDILDH